MDQETAEAILEGINGIGNELNIIGSHVGQVADEVKGVSNVLTQMREDGICVRCEPCAPRCVGESVEGAKEALRNQLEALKGLDLDGRFEGIFEQFNEQFEKLRRSEKE